MTAEFGFFAAIFFYLSLISPASVPGEYGPGIHSLSKLEAGADQ